MGWGGQWTVDAQRRRTEQRVHQLEAALARAEAECESLRRQLGHAEARIAQLSPVWEPEPIVVPSAIALEHMGLRAAIAHHAIFSSEGK